MRRGLTAFDHTMPTTRHGPADAAGSRCRLSMALAFQVRQAGIRQVRAMWWWTDRLFPAYRSPTAIC